MVARMLVDGPVLVTGFDPFVEVAHNTSHAILEQVEGVEGIATCLLPTSFSRAPSALDAAVAEHSPVAVVLLGHAARVVGFRVEVVARSLVTATKPDNDGHTPLGSHLGPHTLLPTTFAIPDVQSLLGADALAVELSDDAGGFVCNAAMYHALSMQALERTPVGFIHVGPLTGYGGANDLDGYVAGILRLAAHFRGSARDA